MTKLLPFDLEAAKAGAKVVTRDGRPARIVCWDVEGEYPIIAVLPEIGGEDKEYYPTSFTINGKLLLEEEREFIDDLFLAPTPVKRWRVVYRGADDNAAQRDFEDYDEACQFSKSCDKQVYVLSTDPFSVEVTP